MKAKLSPTWKKHHDQRKFLKKTGIVLSTETEERQFQEKLMCGKISVSQTAVYFYEKMTNTETRKTVPVASIEDLPGFCIQQGCTSSSDIGLRPIAHAKCPI